jgi:hypothetical protein
MERFYSKVNAIVHNRNLLKDSIIVEEKAEAEQYKKALRLKDNKVRINAVRAKYVRELRASKAAKEEIIIPYKNHVIQELGLHHDQYTILKHDLHYRFVRRCK